MDDFSIVTYKDEPTLVDLQICRKWVKTLYQLQKDNNSRRYREQRSGVSTVHFKKIYRQELKNLKELERKVLYNQK